MTAQTAAVSRAPAVSVELSIAGWFFVAAAAWELLFHRIFTALGIYSHAGAESALALLAESGRFAMNAVGILGMIFACILLPRLAADPRLARLPARLMLMVASPLFLPVYCVSIFRPVSTWLILLSYLIAMGAVLYLTLITVVSRTDGGSRRILAALALIEIIAAFELVFSGLSETVSQRAHLAGEALFLAVPVFAFLLFLQGRVSDLLRRPPVLPLVFATLVTGIGATVAFLATGDTLLPLLLLSVKSLGITLAVPGGATVYLISLFLGALLIGGLIFPSRAIRPTPAMRQQGFGLACIFIAGLQPTHPYLTVLVVVGFLYLSQSMLRQGPLTESRPAAPVSSRQTGQTEEVDTSSLTSAP